MFMAKIRHQSLNLQIYMPPGRQLSWAIDTIIAFLHPIIENAGRWGKPKKYITGQTAPSPFHRSVLISCLQTCLPQDKTSVTIYHFPEILYQLPVPTKSASKETRIGIPDPYKEVLEHH